MAITAIIIPARAPVAIPDLAFGTGIEPGGTPEVGVGDLAAVWPGRVMIFGT